MFQLPPEILEELRKGHSENIPAETQPIPKIVDFDAEKINLAVQERVMIKALCSQVVPVLQSTREVMEVDGLTKDLAYGLADYVTEARRKGKDFTQEDAKAVFMEKVAGILEKHPELGPKSKEIYEKLETGLWPMFAAASDYGSVGIQQRAFSFFDKKNGVIDQSRIEDFGNQSLAQCLGALGGDGGISAMIEGLQTLNGAMQFYGDFENHFLERMLENDERPVIDARSIEPENGHGLKDMSPVNKPRAVGRDAKI